MNRDRPFRPNPGRLWLVVAAAAVASASLAGAQTGPWRDVGNPYQEELDYRFGSTLSPRVELEGVRWRSLRVAAGDDEVVATGEDVDVEVEVEFENREPSSVKLLVILLLEDADGAPLERLELGIFKVGSDRHKKRTEKATMDGDDVLAVRKVYLFCEVIR